ncbi:hypothetical protein C922_05364, partial [Plasmodium inui San Antonio 1]
MKSRQDESPPDFKILPGQTALEDETNLIPLYTERAIYTPKYNKGINRLKNPK